MRLASLAHLALALALMLAVAAGCATREEQGGGAGAAPPGAGTQPAPPARPGTAAPRQFHLGTAATALVAQAHRQAAGGDYDTAAATIERALRIEPENPLLWVELGRVRLGQNNAPQADSMGRKALALGTGDPSAQAAAWRLIGDSLRARGRNGEAYEADRRAASLSPR